MAAMYHFEFVWSTSAPPMVVTVQNLIMVDVIVSIILTFQYLVRLAGKRLFTPTELGFWDYLNK